MAKEFIDYYGDNDDNKGQTVYPHCEDCDVIITNEEVEGSTFVSGNKTYFITYKCKACTVIELSSIKNTLEVENSIVSTKEIS